MATVGLRGIVGLACVSMTARCALAVVFVDRAGNRGESSDNYAVVTTTEP